MVANTANRPLALILGGSTGLGAATAKKLAKEGFDLLIVHRDRRSDRPIIDALADAIVQEGGGQCFWYNVDAVNPAKRNDLWNAIKAKIGEKKIKVLVHSIAKGNLKSMTGKSDTLNNQDFQLTLQAMALSLFDWVKLIADNRYFEPDACVVAFTSEGSQKPFTGYAAVSAAKSTLEAIVRSIALEFAYQGIRANCIQAGVTDTRSLRMIPNHEVLLENAQKRNPSNRLTTPEDVANAVYLLTLPEARWITGTVLKVDGGESLQ